MPIRLVVATLLLALGACTFNAPPPPPTGDATVPVGPEGIEGDL